jgi:hypothetical protein
MLKAKGGTAKSTMGNISYQVSLTADGRPQVSVTADDPAAVADAIPWVAQTYVTLRSAAKAIPTPGTTILKEQEAAAGEPPICLVHQLPMVQVQGRKGTFWSCHEKLPDGSWCSYRPPAP